MPENRPLEAGTVHHGEEYTAVERNHVWNGVYDGWLSGVGAYSFLTGITGLVPLEKAVLIQPYMFMGGVVSTACVPVAGYFRTRWRDPTHLQFPSERVDTQRLACGVIASTISCVLTYGLAQIALSAGCSRKEAAWVAPLVVAGVPALVRNAKSAVSGIYRMGQYCCGFLRGNNSNNNSRPVDAETPYIQIPSDEAPASALPAPPVSAPRPIPRRR